MNNVRQRIKRLIKNVILLLTMPLYALYWVCSYAERSDSVFSGFSQFLSLIPGKLGIYIRSAFYRLACNETSDEISIGFMTLLSHRETTIREGVYIGPQCNIGKCKIAKHTLIGSGVHILSGKHQHNYDNIDAPIQDQGGTFEKIAIGSDCWIGNNSTVMASLPDQSVVASGSVYISELETPGLVIGGNPARAIKQRPS